MPRLVRHQPPPRWHCVSVALALMAAAFMSAEQPASKRILAVILMIARTVPHPPPASGLASSSPRPTHAATGRARIGREGSGLAEEVHLAARGGQPARRLERHPE